MVDRDRELKNLFATQGADNRKEVERSAGRKAVFLNQLIKVILKDKEGLVQPGCEFKIMRRKCTRKIIQDLVNRSPVKVIVDYVYDSSATAMWIEDMMLHAQPEPEHYFIVPKIERIPYDIVPDPTYDGQVSWMITRVPLRTKDNETIVDSVALKEWLVCALIGKV